MLTSYGRPTMNKYSRQQYAKVLDLIAGMKREPVWKRHKKKGADSLDPQDVKRIFEVKIRTPPKGKRKMPDYDNLSLRNKAVAIVFILHTRSCVCIRMAYQGCVPRKGHLCRG